MQGNGNRNTATYRVKLFEKTGMNVAEYARHHGWKTDLVFRVIHHIGKIHFKGVHSLLIIRQLQKDGVIDESELKVNRAEAKG